MKKHIMNLTPSPFKMIKEGKKTIELRLYDEKRKMISIGDTITFVNTEDSADTLCVKVEDLFLYNSFDELYKSLDFNAFQAVLHDSAEQTTTRYAGARQMLYKKFPNLGTIRVFRPYCRRKENFYGKSI